MGLPEGRRSRRQHNHLRLELARSIASHRVTFPTRPLAIETSAGPAGLSCPLVFAPETPQASRDAWRHLPEVMAVVTDLRGPCPFERAGASVVDAPIPFALETQTRPICGVVPEFPDQAAVSSGGHRSGDCRPRTGAPLVRGQRPGAPPAGCPAERGVRHFRPDALAGNAPAGRSTRRRPCGAAPARRDWKPLPSRSNARKRAPPTGAARWRMTAATSPTFAPTTWPCWNLPLAERGGPAPPPDAAEAHHEAPAASRPPTAPACLLAPQGNAPYRRRIAGSPGRSPWAGSADRRPPPQ